DLLLQLGSLPLEFGDVHRAEAAELLPQGGNLGRELLGVLPGPEPRDLRLVGCHAATRLDGRLLVVDPELPVRRRWAPLRRRLPARWWHPPRWRLWPVRRREESTSHVIPRVTEFVQKWRSS